MPTSAPAERIKGSRGLKARPWTGTTGNSLLALVVITLQWDLIANPVESSRAFSKVNHDLYHSCLYYCPMISTCPPTAVRVTGWLIVIDSCSLPAMILKTLGG
jgi:hypothetical protein